MPSQARVWLFCTSPRHDMAWHGCLRASTSTTCLAHLFFPYIFPNFPFFPIFISHIFPIFPYLFPFPPYVYSLFSILFTTFPIFPHFSPPLFLFRFLFFHLKFQFLQAICTVGPIIDPRAVTVVVLWWPSTTRFVLELFLGRGLGT